MTIRRTASPFAGKATGIFYVYYLHDSSSKSLSNFKKYVIHAARK